MTAPTPATTMETPTIDSDTIPSIFLRAFKDCTTNILLTLPSPLPPNDPTTTTAMHTIATQLNHDLARLTHVIRVVQSRVYNDAAWAPAAIRVYKILSLFIDADFAHPDPHAREHKGALLVRYQVLRACQVQFGDMVAREVWSAGVVGFLAELCTTGQVASLTPGIALCILEGMVGSEWGFEGGNFDLLVAFVVRAGPFLDAQAEEFRRGLTERLGWLRQRVEGMPISVRMAVFGLVRLREVGWRMEQVEGGTAQRNPMDVVSWPS